LILEICYRAALRKVSFFTDITSSKDVHELYLATKVSVRSNYMAKRISLDEARVCQDLSSVKAGILNVLKVFAVVFLCSRRAKALCMAPAGLLSCVRN
jgi:hypothetical protein